MSVLPPWRYTQWLRLNVTWSYDSSTVGTDDKDKVRLLIGDTDEDDQQFQDEEIVVLITMEGNIFSTAELCCFSLAARYSKLVDKTVGELRLRLSQRATAYATRAKEIKAHGVLNSAIPFSGGIGQTQKATQEEDDDRVNPGFQIGMHDNPASGPIPASDISVNTSPG